MQEYLSSENLTKKEKILLFKLRVRMTQLKANFSSMHKNNMQCDLCQEEDSIESQTHLLQCSFLTNHEDLKHDIKTIKYEDIYDNLDAQVKAVKVWRKIMKTRNLKLNLK